MPKSATTPQSYPRIDNPKDRYNGCLDDSVLMPHSSKIPIEALKDLIRQAIQDANTKSSRVILAIPDDANTEDVQRIYREAGKELFKYFRDYPSDPASRALQLDRQHYRVVGIEQFRNRTLQKERMNSGWRYQYLAVACARASKRFRQISDLGTKEGDFNSVIGFVDTKRPPLSLYVSVKNRRDTLGGQDWPNAIKALENVAKSDKNKIGPYLSVFGIAIDPGTRYIPRTKDGSAHSVNTEVWLSDYFWPFFSNYNYEEIMRTVLDVLISSDKQDVLPTQTEVPNQLLESFGSECRKVRLIDASGYFNDPYALVRFFCGIK